MIKTGLNYWILGWTGLTGLSVDFVHLIIIISIVMDHLVLNHTFALILSRVQPCKELLQNQMNFIA